MIVMLIIAIALIIFSKEKMVLIYFETLLI